MSICTYDDACERTATTLVTGTHAGEPFTLKTCSEHADELRATVDSDRGGPEQCSFTPIKPRTKRAAR